MSGAGTGKYYLTRMNQKQMDVKDLWGSFKKKRRTTVPTAAMQKIRRRAMAFRPRDVL